MDIHRCRFVPYPPSAINVVAFSYPTIYKSQKGAPVRLAIGRANGDIEIWNPANSAWHQETILRGGKDRSIDGLVWVVEPNQILQDGTKLVGKSRLFSIGYTSTVTEWDLERGRPKKQASGMHGDIWCLAAQPIVPTTKHGSSPANGKLVAGTVDGSLVLYSIEDGDLRFDRVLATLTKKKAKMVSVAFKNPNTVVVGCSDSSIRVYDMRSGHVLRKMTLGSDLAGGAKEIIVWSVKCLAGRDIVSGDSTGQVCIWDGKTYTQAQRLQTHKQDVLSLTTSADGSTIVSGGMDRRTVLYRRTGPSSRWSKVWHRRYHEHDVKTMASFEGNGMSVVVSGGSDATPIVMPLKEAGTENHRTLAHLPQDPPLQSAPRGRMVVGWWEREICVWRLRRPLRELENLSDGESAVEKNRKLVARILIKGETNITSATVSQDGSLLVASTTSDVKAFHLRPRTRKDELKISKIELPEEFSKQGASRVQISPDGRWLCAIQEGSDVVVLPILPRDETPGGEPMTHSKATRLRRIERKTPKHVALGGLGRYDRTVTQIAFSPDSKVLAVADLAGYIDTWILSSPRPKLQNVTQESRDSDVSSSSSEDEEDDLDDTESPRWVRNPKGSLIPRLHAAPTVLSFSDHVPKPKPTSDDETTDDYTLLTVTASTQVLITNPILGSLTSWTRRNPIARFPVQFRNTRDLVRGVLWSGDRVWLYGHSFLFMLDLSQDFPKPVDKEPAVEGMTQGMKRKRGPDTGAGNRINVGAAGPTKIIRQAKGEAPEEIPLDGAAADPMDTDGDDSQSAEESESEEDEDEGHDRGELALLRDAQGRPASELPEGKRLAFWHTYKYRPILGIVPLGGGEDLVTNGANGVNGTDGVDGVDGVNGTVDNDELPAALEVALVERPLWDTDMPDRYFGDGEWER
ncbi:WD40 repeat-like protein [Hypoxylon sp. NC1633]|nr:WD40 repeat-like protein [Hypoxylon sp. NC1633]